MLNNQVKLAKKNQVYAFVDNIFSKFANETDPEISKCIAESKK